jgi:hypothetical protein
VSNYAGFIGAIFLIEETIAPKTGVLPTRYRAIGIDRTARGGVPAIEVTAGLVLIFLYLGNAKRDAAAVALPTGPLCHWSAERSTVNPGNFCAILAARARALSGHELSITLIVRRSAALAKLSWIVYRTLSWAT